MTDVRTIRRIFEDALGLEPEQRPAFLRRVCSDEPTRVAVERLLDADRSEGLLDSAITPGEVAVAVAVAVAGDGAAPQPPAAAPNGALVGRTIGGYRVLRLLGRGGMGDVYEAEREAPKRRVALKVLRSAAIAPGALSRFRHEAEVLARLEHPHIARLYDAGTFDAGLGALPWIAMELVEDGVPITGHAERAGLTIDDRLALFALVCDAVHHGHRKGFIHRDLKPGNILVGADGSPRVIDFGVARTIGTEVTIATLHTMAGQLIGSLRYMSPEQCGGDPDAVDVRSDVYSLGVVLYELLTGILPYDLGETTGILHAPRVICDTPPRPPSLTDHSLRGDIETVLLRALDKSPERRYDSAAGLARDIRHHLAGEALEARRDQRLYVMRKTIARHRPAALAALLVLLILAGTAVGLGILWDRSEGHRRLAEDRAEELRRQNYASSVALARVALDDDNVRETIGLLDRCPEDLRHWEWWYLRALADDTVTVHETASLAFAQKPNYSWTPPSLEEHRLVDFAVCAATGMAVIGSDDGRAHLWDLRRKERVRTLDGLDDPLLYVCFSADGRRVAGREVVLTAPMGVTEFVVWDTESGRELARGSPHDANGRIALNTDGSLCAVGSDDLIVLWDVNANQELVRLTPPFTRTTDVSFSADGSKLASLSDKGLVLWDVATRTATWTLDHGTDHRGVVEFAPDGRHLVLAQVTGAVRIISAEDGSIAWTIRRAAGTAWSAAWSDDGAVLATCHGSSIDLRDAASGELLRKLHAPATLRGGLAFLDGRNRLAVGGADGRLREFDLERRATVTELGAHLVDALSTSPDGRWAATGGRDRSIAMWDLESGAELARWPAHESHYRMHGLAFSADGTLLASSGEDRMVRIWSAPDGSGVAALGPTGAAVLDVAWSPDGQFVFAATRDARVDVWKVAERTRVDSFQPGRPLSPTASWYERVRPRALAVASAGGLVATGGHEKVIRLWRWPGWAPVAELEGHLELTTDLAFSPDGRFLASSAHDGTARLWDTASDEAICTLGSHEGAFVWQVAFSPDGRRLISVAGGPSLRLWDVDSGQLLLVAPGQSTALGSAVAFSGDGRRIIACTADGHVLRIDAPGFTCPSAGP